MYSFKRLLNVSLNIFEDITTNIIGTNWAVFVTQLEEQTLPTPEIRSSNSVICKFYLLPKLCYKNSFEKQKIGRE